MKKPLSEWIIRLIQLSIISLGSLTLASAQFRTTDVKSLWISRSSGVTYSPEAIMAKYPNLHRIYIPVFQFAPIPIDTSSETQVTLSKKISSFKRFGIEVYGIFAPFQLTATSNIAPEAQEISLKLAFRLHSTGRSLSIFSDEAEQLINRSLVSVSDNLQLDGLVLDVVDPSAPLENYSVKTRAYFIRKYDFDPVDFDYPLATSAGVGARLPKEVNTIAEERMHRIDLLLKEMVEIVLERKKRCTVYTLGGIDNFPFATRAAFLADWRKWLLEGTASTIILGKSTLSGTYSSLVQETTKEISGENLNAQRISFLAANSMDFVSAVNALRRTKGESSAESIILLESIK